LEALDLLGHGFATLFEPARIGFMLGGVLLGVLIGVLPGVGGTTGVAILLPVTVFLEPVSALVMLAGIYWGSLYGGSITSILFGVPGNPWSVATMFDGRPLAKKGKAQLALSMSFTVSFVGALVASILFTFFAIPFAQIAFKFGPPEMFAVLMIALATFIGLGGSPAKTTIMIAAGYLLATVGLDIVTGQPRFTFGSIEMLHGFNFVPVTIGLFGIGEVLNNAAERHKVKIEEVTRAAKLSIRDFLEAVRVLINKWWLALGSSLLGFVTGVLPGSGATPASFMAYGIAQKTSKHPEEFGKGAVEGVLAPEAANNAAGTGSILPMLVLGIPGSPTAAIIMAGVFMWGFIPGPRLFTEQPEFVWSFVASLYAANIAAVAICLTATPLLAVMLRTPYSIIAPIIVVFCLIGAFTIQNSMFDVWLALIFGVIGFVLRRLQYPMAPLVVALVLGAPTETYLRQSLIMGDGSIWIFFQRPISVWIMIAAIILLFWPLYSLILKRVRRRRAAAAADGG
jgi:putative tricarboxylic transport membrane protein